MAFAQGIQTINFLAGTQTVASSVVPVDVTGFTFLLGAGKRLEWELNGIFALGATGGFRFLAHNTSAPTTYAMNIQVVDETTPATFQDAQLVEAAFTNASAVAGNYLLTAWGEIIANAGTTFSFQFAQNNSQVTGIVMQPGTVLKLWQH
jgi:hypothetical protein